MNPEISNNFDSLWSNIDFPPLMASVSCPGLWKTAGGAPKVQKAIMPNMTK